jgi:hypothetical protein
MDAKTFDKKFGREESAAPNESERVALSAGTKPKCFFQIADGHRHPSLALAEAAEAPVDISDKRLNFAQLFKPKAAA